MLPLLVALVTLTPVGHVSDFAHLLQPATIVSLEQTLQSLETQTGVEIALVTIDTHGSDETIESYAVKLFEKWGIGKEEEDNGLLLLISRDDREMRIEVGYGLEPIITDLESSRIIREVLTPAFQEGKYDEGVISAVERIKGSIERGSPPVEEAKPLPFNIGDAIPFLLFLLMFLSSILARSKSWWAGGVIGGILGWIFFTGLLWIAGLTLVGLLFDYVVSKTYRKSKLNGVNPPWWIGGPGRGGPGGGFGGFGGGMSGGGGASGKW